MLSGTEVRARGWPPIARSTRITTARHSGDDSFGNSTELSRPRRQKFVNVSAEFPKDFPDAPLLITLARRGFRLDEVPVTMRDRKAGESFYTLGKQLYYPYKNLLASLMALIRKPI